MDFEERLGALGVDLSDLPKSYNAYRAKEAFETAYDWCEYNQRPVAQFILHLTDIIDRMETRIVNLTGERDFLKHIVNEIGTCAACAHIGNPDYCVPCINTPGTRFEPCEGVPEDWRPDDD